MDKIELRNTNEEIIQRSDDGDVKEEEEEDGQRRIYHLSLKKKKFIIGLKTLNKRKKNDFRKKTLPIKSSSSIN